jgi:hypothetical protein
MDLVHQRSGPMPIVLFILLAILVANIGFWNTLGAMLGAVGVMILFSLILLATIAVAGLMALKRLASR